MRTALALLALLGGSDTIFASSFDPTIIVEFTIAQPLLTETVTCNNWSAPWDSTQWGRIEGSKCEATGTIPDRTGTQGGDVDATFYLLDDTTVTLTDCKLGSLSASGGSGSAIVTYNIDCT